jgi:hypothetical protein
MSRSARLLISSALLLAISLSGEKNTAANASQIARIQLDRIGRIGQYQDKADSTRYVNISTKQFRTCRSLRASGWIWEILLI